MPGNTLQCRLYKCLFIIGGYDYGIDKVSFYILLKRFMLASKKLSGFILQSYKEVFITSEDAPPTGRSILTAREFPLP
jgi:hypothetical protein